MNLHIKLFSITRDIVGANEIALEFAEQMTVAELLEHLCRNYPKLLEWKRYLRVAVNREYVSAQHILSANDEVAIIPPVSGG